MSGSSPPGEGPFPRRREGPSPGRGLPAASRPLPWERQRRAGAVCLLAAALLAACASAPVGADPLPHGDANYDALKAATQTCEAQGGKLSLRNGYDGRDLANYDCKSVKAP